MPTKCSVSGCNSNQYKQTFSTFSFPRAEPRRSQWIKAINKKNFIPKKCSAVCIKHFDPKFVKLYDSCMRSDGSVLTVKRSKPGLSKDAIPTIFNNTSKHLNTNHPNQISMLPYDHYLPEKSTQNTQTLDHVSNGTTATIDEVYIKEEILEVKPTQSTQTPDHVSDETTEIDIKEEKFEVDPDPLEDSGEPSSQCSENAEVIHKVMKEEHDLLSEDLPHCRETFDEFQDNQHRLESQEPASKFSESSDIVQSKNQNLDPEQPPSHCRENSDKDKKQILFYLVLTPINTKELICPTCTMKFKNQCSFDQHLKDCKGSKKRRRRGKMEKVCTTCGRVFKTWIRFYSHQICHSKERPYSCDTCERSFKRKADLEDHRALHSDERPFMCSICALSFKRKRNLIQHQKTHSKHHQITHFKQHKLTYSKKRKIRQFQPYLCSTCGMIFKLKNSFDKHVVCHSEERPHLCEICGFGFKRKGDLHHHLVSHSEERPFSCNICGFSFKRKKNLIAHNRTHKESAITSSKESLRES